MVAALSTRYRGMRPLLARWEDKSFSRDLKALHKLIDAGNAQRAEMEVINRSHDHFHWRRNEFCSLMYFYFHLWLQKHTGKIASLILFSCNKHWCMEFLNYILPLYTVELWLLEHSQLKQSNTIQDPEFAESIWLLWKILFIWNKMKLH